MAFQIKAQRQVLAQLASLVQLADQPACAFFKEQVLEDSLVIKTLLNCALHCLCATYFSVISPVTVSFPVLMMTKLVSGEMISNGHAFCQPE